MKIFELDGKLYSKVVPAKTLFHSTMVHEAINRGDVFAVRLQDMSLTILNGKLVEAAEKINAYVVPHEICGKAIEVTVKQPAPKIDTVTVAKMKKQLKAVDAGLEASKQLLMQLEIPRGN